MGIKQLSLLNIDTYLKPTQVTIKKEKKPKKRQTKINEPVAVSLFDATGFRRSGLFKKNERFACLRCEREINLYPRLFCHDCRCSGAYRFSECY